MAGVGNCDGDGDAFGTALAGSFKRNRTALPCGESEVPGSEAPGAWPVCGTAESEDEAPLHPAKRAESAAPTIRWREFTAGALRDPSPSHPASAAHFCRGICHEP